MVSEEKPMTFLAIQDKFLKDLNFHVTVSLGKAGYSHVGYPSLIEVLGSALKKAHELNAMEKERIAYEKEAASE